MPVANLPTRAIAAVVGWVTIVVREAATFDALLANRTFIVGGAVGDTDPFAARVELGTGGLLAVLIGWAIAVVRARGIFFRLHGLAGAADTNAAITILIAEADTRGI